MLSGDLTDFSLGDVLRLLATTGKSGRLTLHGAGSDGGVFLRDGGVCLALLDITRVPLAPRMIVRGSADREELAAAVRAADGTAFGLACALVGAVDHDAGAALVADHTRETIGWLAQYFAATFEFDSSAGVDAWPLEPLPVEQVLADVERYARQWAELRGVVEDLSLVPTCLPDLPDGAAAPTLTASQWRLVALIDGQRTIKELVEAAGLSQLDACRQLAGLIGDGLVELVHPGARSAVDALLADVHMVDRYAISPVWMARDDEVAERIVAGVLAGDADGDTADALAVPGTHLRTPGSPRGDRRRRPGPRRDRSRSAATPPGPPTRRPPTRRRTPTRRAPTSACSTGSWAGPGAPRRDHPAHGSRPAARVTVAMRPETSTLGQILLAKGLVTEDVLADAQFEQREMHKPLGRILVDRQVITEVQLLAGLAEQMSLEFVDLRDQPVDGTAVVLVPEVLARRHGIIPIGFDEDGRLRLAMSDPANVLAIDDVRTITERAVVPVVATYEDVLAAIDQYHSTDVTVDSVASELDAGDDVQPDDVGPWAAESDNAPIVRFVNAIVQQAVGARASDIHIEPGEREVQVRLRIDGVLHTVTRQRRSIHAGVVSRLKIMADLDIAERRLPQDGRISLRSGGRQIDLRVSTLPTVHGEKVVMRILDKTTIQLKLSELGFLDHNYARYERNFRRPYGMILVTGPTGSGKSTTLYATLNVLASPDVNVVTTEDPVEYQLAGISQVQINTKTGLTFPRALRSILRQDPDIVLVGEMRDHETAQIGMEAALTGHLVLSTLHTNDAPSAVTRLTEMGIDGFLVASAVDCVLAQRLARRLCDGCREPYQPTGTELRAAGLPWRDGDPLPTLWRAVGCRRCGDTGYRGRLAIHEVMEVGETIEKLIVAGAARDQIREAARAEGMLTLREDGLAKVLLGETTLKEIARVVA